MDQSDTFLVPDRQIIELQGPDAKKFLQGLVTNDIGDGERSLRYAAMLNPQGKYLFDFFIISVSPSRFLIDISSSISDAFIRKLKIYKLRSDLTINLLCSDVLVGFCGTPSKALRDPRSPEMGWRRYLLEGEKSSQYDLLNQNFYDDLRVNLMIPETGIELIQEKTYILEAGFERLNGVSFSKGCYVGQEVTARMKHKADLQKGLAKVRILGELVTSDLSIIAGQKAVGHLLTRSNDLAIAYLRFKFCGQILFCGNTKIEILERF
ncbi:MAG: folate-binding protein [Pseudomonadota bacterium]|nr:folate-binding protein [Pseudomonadota bacterium]